MRFRRCGFHHEVCGDKAGHIATHKGKFFTRGKREDGIAAHLGYGFLKGIVVSKDAFRELDFVRQTAATGFEIHDSIAAVTSIDDKCIAVAGKTDQGVIAFAAGDGRNRRQSHDDIIQIIAA